MGDWVVALILLALSLVVIVAAALVCRVLGVWRLSSFFASGEESAVLTKSEHRNGYMVTSESDLHLDTQGRFVQYDTLASDPGYINLDETTGQPQGEARQPSEELKDVSPVSADSVSVVSASDLEQPDVVVRGGLQRAMSCDSVASDSSVMELEPDAPKIGQLEFGLEYDREMSELVVSVIQARDLEANEVTGTLDSYVKLWLTPHGSTKTQTKVQKGTTDPVYKERFLFNVDSEHVDRQQLQFQVYSSDKYARHKLLGETELRLGDIELRQPIRVWMNLRDLDEKPTDLGDMMFSLSYLPTAERLTVVIVKARNLKWAHGRQNGDCFVKVYLLQNNKKVGKKKTSTKRDESNPIFNEAMIFSVPATTLQSVQLRITVYEPTSDTSKFSSIGHVIVGSQTSGTELTHWNQMMTSLRKPVAMWHRLRK